MQSKLLGSSTQLPQEQSVSMPATGAAGQPKAIPPSPNVGVPRPGQFLSRPKRPFPWLLEAAPEREQACVIARCSKHRAWFVLLMEQQDAETWKAVRAKKISDEEAVRANAEPGAAVGRGVMSQVSGTLAFSVPCPYCAVKKYGKCSCGTLNCFGQARCHEWHTDFYCSACCTWACVTGKAAREVEALREGGPGGMGGPQGQPSAGTVTALPAAGGALIRRG